MKQEQLKELVAKLESHDLRRWTRNVSQAGEFISLRCYCGFTTTEDSNEAQFRHIAEQLLEQAEREAVGQGLQPDDVVLHAKRDEGHWDVDVDKRLDNSGFANGPTLHDALVLAIEMAIENRHWRQTHCGENLDLSLDAAPRPEASTQAIDSTVSITIRGQEQVACVMEALHKAGFVVAQAALAAQSEQEKK